MIVRALSGIAGASLMLILWALVRTAEPMTSDDPLVIAWGVALGALVGWFLPSGR